MRYRAKGSRQKGVIGCFAVLGFRVWGVGVGGVGGPQCTTVLWVRAKALATCSPSSRTSSDFCLYQLVPTWGSFKPSTNLTEQASCKANNTLIKYHWWLRSLLSYLCYVFQALINSLVCWFCKGNSRVQNDGVDRATVKNPCGRLPRWQTALMRGQPYRRPTLVKDYSDKRPPWTLNKDLWW